MQLPRNATALLLVATTPSILLAILLAIPLATLLAAGCGEPPRPVRQPAPAPGGQQDLPPDHPPMDRPPAQTGAQPPAQPAGPPRHATFEGTLVLPGELASIDEGALYVSVMDLGGRTPAYSLRIAVDDARIQREEGRALVPFVLNESHAIMGGGLPPGDLQLSAVWYKDQGMVGNERGASKIVSVEPDASGLEVVLEPE